VSALRLCAAAADGDLGASDRIAMEEKDRRFIRLLGVLSTVGITLVAATVIGYFLGLFLDRAFGTTPWLTVLFLIFGIAAGFKNLFEQARKVQDLDQEPGKGSDDGERDQQRTGRGTRR
jgi:ATP synthase protein I